jgi:Tol biopolymer transport system component
VVNAAVDNQPPYPTVYTKATQYPTVDIAEGSGDVYIYDTKTGLSTKVDPQSAYFYNVQLSNDGTKLVFTAADSSGSLQVYLADAAFKNVTQLTTGAITHGNAALSPDASLVAFDSGGGTLYTIPAAGGTATQVPLTNLFGGGPIFTPNGRSLVFAGTAPPPADGPISSIYIVNFDGSGLAQLSNATPENGVVEIQDRFPSLSADGTHVAFERDTYIGSYAKNVAVIGIGGESAANPATILTSDNLSWQPIYMDDKILFMSSKDNPTTGNDNIYEMNADGSDLVRLTDTTLETCFNWGI